MKKKRLLNLLVSLLVVLVCLSGCGQREEQMEHDEKQMESIAEFFLQNFGEFSTEQFEVLEKSSEFDLNTLLSQAHLPVDAQNFKEMLNSWKAGVDECGEYISHGPFTMEPKAEGCTLKAKTHFSNRDGVISFTFNNEARLESLTVSGEYSTSEILKKAGMNTLLGMGTVFVMLIFIAWIISLIKYIPGLVEKRKAKKDASKKMEEVKGENPILQEKEEEDLLSEEELVAVIAAAIATYEGTTTDDFVVRTIKKRRPNRHW